MLIQYVGFNVAASSRIYNFDVIDDTAEAREFTVKVQSGAFRPARLKLQDGPGICFARLKQELQGETQESRVEAQLSIGEQDIQEYLVLHSPPKPSSSRRTVAEPSSSSKQLAIRKALSPQKEGTPMISARNLLIPILGAILSAASLICAQDVKPPEPTVALQPPPVIQELTLQPQRFLAFSLRTDPVPASFTDAADLSRYREFRFGMDLFAVAKQAEMQPSQARAIHQRPAVIQELQWRPQRSLAYSPQADPV